MAFETLQFSELELALMNKTLTVALQRVKYMDVQSGTGIFMQIVNHK